MTPEFLRHGTPAAVLAALPGSRAVGGAVRDFLCEPPKAIHDVDVAVALPPLEVARRLREAGLKVFETGLQHGTVTAVLERQPVEVTSLRRDVATDGRHAEVEWIGDWREDAARRDFTINAMSMGLDGVLHDYFGGMADLRAGCVRFVGVPGARLAEDYLRALRFFRFWARYGRGAPDGEAVAAIRDAVPGLARLSVERVWMEIKRLLQAPEPPDALRLMERTGVMGAVLPEALPVDLAPLERLVARAAPVDALLRLAALLPAGADHVALGQRLKLSSAEVLRLAHILDQSAMLPPGASEAELLIWRALSRFGMPPDAHLPLWLADARDGLDRAAERAAIHGPPPAFPLQGRDALALGVPPGPDLGRLLGAVEAWWLREAATRASRADCLEKLREYAKRNTAP
ncbi:CCA tRNA nucleotidyltransferase [Rhodovarius sp.]|uniref:CCA tRNA nucleotidyltransferase n=1 Tax=Rhodovarius sp. TaxID=2972673 RepID=UPI0034A23D7D